MTRSRLPQLLSVFVLLLACTPAIAHACPMCFAGGDENKDAFLYGSIFLMVVPVLSLGGLGFWAYRRLKAIDDGMSPPDADAPDVPQNSSGNGVVLHMASRR